MFKDYYQILGIKSDAGPDLIRRSYRELAFRFHPDRNPDDQEAARQFLDVQEAYHHLSDPRRRGIYDHKWLVANREKQSHAHQDNYEFVRRRREARYYREDPENASGLGSGSNYRNRRGRSTGASIPVSDRVNEYLMRELEARVRAFRVLARIMRILGIIVVLASGTILLDGALATPQKPEMVIETNRLSMRRNNGVSLASVRTTYHRFEIYRANMHYLRPGKEVILSVSPLAGVITRVEFTYASKTYRITPYDSLYNGVTRFFLIVLLLMGLTTGLVRINDEFTAYLGTFTLIALITLLSIGLNS